MVLCVNSTKLHVVCVEIPQQWLQLDLYMIGISMGCACNLVISLLESELSSENCWNGGSACVRARWLDEFSIIPDFVEESGASAKNRRANRQLRTVIRQRPLSGCTA